MRVCNAGDRKSQTIQRNLYPGRDPELRQTDERAERGVSELLENTQDAQQVIADGKAVAEKLLEINMEVVNGDLYLEMPDTLSKEGTT